MTNHADIEPLGQEYAFLWVIQPIRKTCEKKKDASWSARGELKVHATYQRHKALCADGMSIASGSGMADSLPETIRGMAIWCLFCAACYTRAKWDDG